ncbi:unnamed protein product [Caenorhabditis auriculariae]|uniref:SET domain-containing protein n=1 Tax=Caenorhabditis auriculariae TaxID=2777116 RepID=A0A8S1HNS2_9PELO|nr:unnamed protein product [Caenorhabditis auriculariae]
MGLEAVPCLFTRPEEPARGKQCFGYLIREKPADVSETPSTSGTPSYRILPSTSKPLMVGGDTSAPKVLLPAGKMKLSAAEANGVAMSAAPSQWPNGVVPKIISINGQIASNGPNISSPTPSQPRSASVCSSSSVNETSPMSPSPMVLHRQERRNGPSMTMPNFGSCIPPPGTTWVVSTAPGSSGMTSNGHFLMSDSSTTPDSGIQSVPTSPPNSNTSIVGMETCYSVCEEKEFEDYADMPRLLPADQEDEEEQSATVPPPLLLSREDGASHGSECETAAAPSISISPSMPSDEIVNRLLALDPEKASAIAALIKKKTQRKRRSGTNEKNDDSPPRSSPKAKKARTQPPSLRKNTKSSATTDQEDVVVLQETSDQTADLQNTLVVLLSDDVSPAEDEKPSCSTANVEPLFEEPVVEEIEEETKQERNRKRKSSKPIQESQKDDEEIEEEENEEQVAVQYRLAVQKSLENALMREVELCITDMQALNLGPITKNPRDKKTSWLYQLDQLKKRWAKVKHSGGGGKLREEKQRIEKLQQDLAAEKEVSGDVKCRKSKKPTRKVEKKPMKPAKKEPPKTTKRGRILVKPSMTSASPSSTHSGDFSAEFHGPVKNPTDEFEEIPRSVACDETEVPQGWEAPSLQCGCTRGACTSDAECVNRALRIRCSSNCSVQLCANKKFWREDTSRLMVSYNAANQRVLRTRHSRHAGEFLCEFVGEVITYAEARRRAAAFADDEHTSRILCLNSRLFIDASHKSSISRYIRHSCRPNSRLEVWASNGRYRAGIFSLFEIASGSEITIDKNNLLVAPVNCSCESGICCRRISAARYPMVAADENDMSRQEERVARQRKVLLMRNRRRVVEGAQRTGLPASWACPVTGLNNGELPALRKLFDAVAYRIRRVDGSFPFHAIKGYNALRKFLSNIPVSPTDALETYDNLMRAWLDAVDDDDVETSFVALRSKVIEVELPAAQSDAVAADAHNKKTPSKRPSLTSSTTTSLVPAPGSVRVISKQTDLAYLHSDHPVGSYDPDEVWPREKAEVADNAVRCICGSLEEDGDMLQCDTCHFWLHIDCVGGEVNLEDDYTCQFCNNSIPVGGPSTDVRLRVQPTVRFDQCVYYRALMNRRPLQVRLNETVFVKKVLDDEHKKILRKLVEISDHKKKKGGDVKREETKCKAIPKAEDSPLPRETFNREDLRIFRVERIFTAPGNNRFVFGFYYAWPHETFCDSQRFFHPNEVFATPLYDTLPLDAVVGRCVVLEPSAYCSGRPIVPLFKEEDVYICEYQIDRSQRSFEKIPSKNRYPINTQPYVFEKFDRPRALKRDFTPFVVTDRSVTSSSGRSSTKLNISPNVDSRRFDRNKKNAIRNLGNIIEKLKTNP